MRLCPNVNVFSHMCGLYHHAYSRTHVIDLLININVCEMGLLHVYIRCVGGCRSKCSYFLSIFHFSSTIVTAFPTDDNNVRYCLSYGLCIYQIYRVLRLVGDFSIVAAVVVVALLFGSLFDWSVGFFCDSWKITINCKRTH